MTLVACVRVIGAGTAGATVNVATAGFRRVGGKATTGEGDGGQQGDQREHELEHEARDWFAGSGGMKGQHDRNLRVGARWLSLRSDRQRWYPRRALAARP